MYEKIDTDMLNEIFCLSDQSLVRMVNHLFRTEYTDDESIWKEWHAPESSRVTLVVRGTARYEFGIRHLDGCVQLQAEERKYRFYETGLTAGRTARIQEPRMTYFGGNIQEEYAVTWEFPGHESVHTPVQTVTFSERSAKKLEEKGLVIFLPFLFYLFCGENGQEDHLREALKYFVIHDIVGTLNLSMQRGNLNVYDVQRLKQLCRRMLWRLLPGRTWMQELELQELVLSVLEADMELVERVHCLELQKLQNK